VAPKSKISIVANQTKLTGQVESGDILVIAGYVEGDVLSRKVIIKNQGRVQGNITCSSLIIEPGGVFDGRAFMSTGSSGDSLAQKPS